MNALILSFGLDTNGQNARYVKASEQYGMSDEILSVLALGKYDPAGVVGRFQAAADPAVLRIRSAHKATHIYQQMPPDILWTRETEKEIKTLADAADVIHLNNSWRAYTHFRLSAKPALLHHHGSMFRTDPRLMLRKASQMRMAQAVSTIDLQQPDPEVLPWLPTAYNVNELKAFGKKHQREPDGRIRVVSAPTNRALKSTVELEQAVRSLQAEGLPIDLVLIEGQTWAECMAMKATADIVFDQVMFGYGCNAVEAWGMGIPVIAGGDAWTMERMRSEWGALPFYEATIPTIADSIRTLMSEDARAEWAERGTAHVRKYHDDKPALARLAELYMAAMKRQVSGRTIPAKSSAITGGPGKSWGQLLEDKRRERLAKRRGAAA